MSAFCVEVCGGLDWIIPDGWRAEQWSASGIVLAQDADRGMKGQER